MKTFYTAENDKDRQRISRALVDLEAATLALCNADRVLAMAEGRPAGEAHAEALAYYNTAGKAFAAAYVALKRLKERSADLADKPQHSAQIIPLNSAIAEKHEADGLPVFSLAKEQEGDR